MAVKKKAKKSSVHKGMSRKRSSSSTKKAAKGVKKKTTKKPARNFSSSRIRKAVKESSGEKQRKNENDLKKLLLSRRRKILDEARDEISKFIHGDTRQLVDTAMDDGDWSFVDMAKGIDLKKLAAQKDTLNKIEEALRKIDEGTYGVCEDCGSDISEERLKVIPFATLCVECKEQREKMEEFESSGSPWLLIEDLM